MQRFARFWMAAALAASALGSAPVRGHAQGVVWPGTITRTETFNGMEDGRQVTYRREERWENFVVKLGDPAGTLAFFDTTWTMRMTRKEVSEDCTTTIEAHGSAPYPWFHFSVNPLNGVSYSIASTGTGGGPWANGTETMTCRDEPPSTRPYEALSSWLAAPFPLSAEMLPPGFELPQMDALPFGPTVSGTLDPANPDLVSGSASGQAGGEGPLITLTWNLSRSSECGDEQGARDLVAHESARLHAAEAAQPAPEGQPAPAEDAPVEPEAAVMLRAAALPAPQILSNQPLSGQVVADALAGALGQPDRIALREQSGDDAAGLRPFAVRLSADGRALPTLASLQHLIDTTCVQPGSLPGAPTLLFGSVQWFGNTFRINVRTVETETGVVTDAASVSGTGGSAELQMALESAFAQFIRG